MTFVREQEIKIEGQNVYIIDVIVYENKQYLYVQEIQNDELIDKYGVYQYDSERNAMIRISEQTLLNTLLGLFSENIKTTLEEL